MSLEEQKIMIADMIQGIGDDIGSGSNIVSKAQGQKYVWRLYEVMRLISNWSEDSGY